MAESARPGGERRPMTGRGEAVQAERAANAVFAHDFAEVRVRVADVDRDRHVEPASGEAPCQIDPYSGETASTAYEASLFNGDPTRYRFTPDEDRLLEELERACFRFFWDEVNPSIGLVKDRSQAGGPDSRNVASIAATGFGLTALCIADHRSWEDAKRIRERAKFFDVALLNGPRRPGWLALGGQSDGLEVIK